MPKDARKANPLIATGLIVNYLQLVETEASSLAQTSVVLKCLASHLRSQASCSWPRSDCKCLVASSSPSALLAGGLVEPCLHVLLPVLVEMAIWNSIVSLTHLLILQQ